MVSIERTVFITGGGTGIGAACALALAREGFRVAIGGRREEKLIETAAKFSGEPPILVRSLDIGDRQSVTAAFDWVRQELGQLDVLINSAGVNVPKRATGELSADDWDKVLNINASGIFYCMNAVLPRMRQRKDGLIINISSIAGIRASTLGGVAYSASKFAMSALGLTTAREVKDDGVRITTVYPGEVETPILESRPQPVSAEHRARILQPEDVAAAVVMIANLPPRAHVSEIAIKPTTQDFA